MAHEPDEEMLMKVLMTYASRHGSTREIAERVAGELERHGAEVDLQPVQDVGPATPYDAVVLGSAVYFGSWLRPALAFVRQNRAELAQRPVWLFSSGPVADAVLPAPKELAEVMDSVRPRDHRVFAGALDTGKLTLSERLLTRMVHAPLTDSRDWEEITAWASGIATQVLVPSGVAS